MDKKAFIAVVQFEGSSKKYDFNCAHEVKPGDKVVVDCATGHQFATVCGTKNHSCHVKPSAWVIAKLEPNPYEQENIRQQMAAVWSKMVIREEALPRETVFHALSHHDSVVNRLWHHYQELKDSLRE